MGELEALVAVGRSFRSARIVTIGDDRRRQLAGAAVRDSVANLVHQRRLLRADDEQG